MCESKMCVCHVYEVTRGVMSKYLGKLLLESGAVEEPGQVCVKYSASRDAFCFRIESGESGIRHFYVGKDLCFELASIIGMLDFQYRWSVGYKVKEKKGVSELGSMRLAELGLLGGRRELILSGALDNDEDFDTLCVIQYLYQFSETLLDKVMCERKRHKWGRSSSNWVQMKKRVLGKSGRKKGGKNSNKGLDSEDEKESLEDILSRCAHNKAVAIQRGFYTWYKEACEEEAKALGKKLDKVKMLVQWNKEREKQQ